MVRPRKLIRPPCSVEGCDRFVAAKGLCKLHYYRVKRLGHTGPAGLMIGVKGSGCLFANGYIVVGAKYRRKPMHVAIVERVLGRQLPPGAHVHHVNGIKSDNRPENLVVCPSQAYHGLLHARQRALDACGNANWSKCSFCGEYDDPANMRVANSGNKLRHAACYNKWQRERLLKRRAALLPVSPQQGA